VLFLLFLLSPWGYYRGFLLFLSELLITVISLLLDVSHLSGHSPRYPGSWALFWDINDGNITYGRTNSDIYPQLTDQKGDTGPPNLSFPVKTGNNRVPERFNPGIKEVNH